MSLSHPYQEVLPVLLVKSVITCFRLITPLAFILTGANLTKIWRGANLTKIFRKKKRWSTLLIAAQFYLLVECWFYFFLKTRAKALNRPRKPPKPLSFLERKALMDRCDSIVRDGEIAVCSEEEFVTGWFLGAPLKKIHKGNLLEWTAATNYFAKFEDLNEKEKGELSEWMEWQYRKLNNWTPKEGYNPEVKCMKLVLDPIAHVHRPLLLYGIVKSVDYFVRAALYSMGFRKELQQPEGIPYWYWLNDEVKNVPALSAHSLPDPNTPVVLIHGIGPAFFPYLPLIRRIRYLPHHQRPPAIFLIELPHISMQLSAHVPNSQQTVEAISTVMSRHGGWRQARFVGHSYGTYVAAWVIKQRPQLVSGVILIDPVCFLTFIPKTAYSFLYKQPVTAHDHMINYFVSRELHIAHVLTRHFWWWENCLWAEEIKCPMTVFLSGQDSIVPSPAVSRYLSKHHIDSYYYPSFPHAGFLLDFQATKDITDSLINYCRKPQKKN